MYLRIEILKVWTLSERYLISKFLLLLKFFFELQQCEEECVTHYLEINECETKGERTLDSYRKVNVYLHICLTRCHYALYMCPSSKGGWRLQSVIPSECIDIAASMNILISALAHSFGLPQRESFCKHGH